MPLADRISEDTEQPGLNVVRADASKEYVAVDNGARSVRPAVVPTHSDSCENLPTSTIEMMQTDPVVWSNLHLLKELVLADGLQVIPKVVDEDTQAPDSVTAGQYAEFIGRCMEDYLEGASIREFCEGLLDAVPYGNKVGEHTMQRVESGPDAGQLVTKYLKLKDSSSIYFLIDAFWNILGIQPAYGPDTNRGLKLDANSRPVLPRSKFVILTITKKNEDVRGRQGFRSIFASWKFKQELWPILQKFLKICAIPGLIGEVAPNQQVEVAKNDDGTVKKVNGQPVVLNPTDVMLQALLAFEKGSAMAVQSGAKVTTVEQKSNGELFDKVIEMVNREITVGQLRTTRATTEAEHGSKADSTTSLSLLTTYIWFLKQRLCDVLIRDYVRPLMLFNFGPESLRLAPAVAMGETDRYDWSKDATAIAALAVYLADSQFDALCLAAGIEPPLPGEERPPRAKVAGPEDNAPGAKEKKVKAMEEWLLARQSRVKKISARDVMKRETVKVRIRAA